MTRTATILARHSLRRTGTIVLVIGIVLAGFQFLLTQVATYLQRTQAFGLLTTLLPEFMRQLAGPSMLLSFTGVVSLGYFHPIVLTTFVGLAIGIATEPASEIEQRFVDLTLARPARRTDLITRTVMVLVIAEALVLTMMAIGTWSGLTCCTPATATRPSVSAIASLATNLAVVAWCWGGIGLAAGAMAKRRTSAAGFTGVAALAAYLLDYLGRVWEPARGVSRASPFHYFDPMPLIAGNRLDVAKIGALVAAGLAGVILSYWVMSRRDV